MKFALIEEERFNKLSDIFGDCVNHRITFKILNVRRLIVEITSEIEVILKLRALKFLILESENFTKLLDEYHLDFIGESTL